MRARKSILRRAVLATAVVMLGVLVTAGPASANAGLSQSLTAQQAVAVGDTVPASFTITNTNTPPQNAESHNVTSLRIAPGCGAVGTFANPCAAPDPGVMSVLSATGAAGTACAGITFTPSVPDASGIVTLTPTAVFVLAPPGAVGPDRCTVNLSLRVLKVPNIDVNIVATGTQTRFNVVSQTTSVGSGLMPTVASTVEVTVVRATPSLVTQASPATVVGSPIFDTATVTGVANIAAPTGTVTFQLYGPNDNTCSGATIFQSTNPLVGGSATSTSFVTSQPGIYRFTAAYNGDANYISLFAVCNAVNESVIVSAAPVDRPVNDFDGNGTTDVAVFRPANGTWFLRTATPSLVAWGQEGDIPVPGDYDGNGTVDIAVFRPANNAWYIRTPTPQFVLWGEAGDIPVPADYDGNGTTDIAIFRPSTGTWYLRTASPTAVVWGQVGDIPVPGDYDGNGTVDVAVFRPSNNAWYLRTTTPQFVLWGETGDIPVPGDYDNNGTTDIAIFRPATGTWYLRTASPSAVVWGQAGDVPAPGDYDGNGGTDIAVFRPSNSSWYIRTPTPQFVAWGQAGDKALSLPDAIRRFF
jgi:hypothetical protein